jgi:hypothetical protein
MRERVGSQRREDRRCRELGGARGGRRCRSWGGAREAASAGSWETPGEDAGGLPAISQGSGMGMAGCVAGSHRRARQWSSSARALARQGSAVAIRRWVSGPEARGNGGLAAAPVAGGGSERAAAAQPPAGGTELGRRWEQRHGPGAARRYDGRGSKRMRRPGRRADASAGEDRGGAAPGSHGGAVGEGWCWMLEVRDDSVGGKEGVVDFFPNPSG